MIQGANLEASVYYLENRRFYILYNYSIHIRIPNKAKKLGIKYWRTSSENLLVCLKCLITNLKNYARTNARFQQLL